MADGVTLAAVVDQYLAGLEAETSILLQLQRVVARQHEASEAHDLDALNAAGDERDRLMEALVRIDGPLREIRQTLATQRNQARTVPGYADALARHAQVVALVSTILKTDEASVEALEKAELARRDAARATAQGETTLAAYRRVISAAPGATLVDRRG